MRKVVLSLRGNRCPRDKVCSVSGAIAAYVTVTLLRVSCTVPPQKSIALLSVRVACPEFTSFTSYKNRLEWSERIRTASFHSEFVRSTPTVPTRSEEVKTHPHLCRLRNTPDTRAARYFNAPRSPAWRYMFPIPPVLMFFVEFKTRFLCQIPEAIEKNGPKFRISKFRC